MNGNDLEQLHITRQRARHLAKQGESARAHGYFTHADDVAQSGVGERKERILFLHEHLDLCESWLPRDAPELLAVAERLRRVTDGQDARAFQVLGFAGSLQARRAQLR